MGPEPQCLAAVLVELPNGHYSLGSGYLLDATYVLTARHVLHGKEPGSPVQQAAYVRFPGMDAGERQARLAWPGDEQLDVAILALKEPLAGPPGPPVRWGRLPLPKDAPEPLPCVVVGFPRTAEEVDRHDGVTVRDSKEFRGQINLLSGLVQGRLEVAEIGQVLTNQALEALSGGPVFVADHLVGVVYGYLADFASIWVIPVSRLFADEGFRSLPVAETGLEPVAVNQPPAPFQVPYLAHPCLGRDALLNRLADLVARPGAAVALHGIGGSGKTFLASTFAHQTRARFPGGVFWLNLADATDLTLQIAACAGPGGLDLPGLDGMSLDDRAALLASQPIPRPLLMRLGTQAPQPGTPDGPVADGLNRLLALGLIGGGGRGSPPRCEAACSQG